MMSGVALIFMSHLNVQCIRICFGHALGANFAVGDVKFVKVHNLP